MNAYRIIGLVGLVILFIIFLLGSILYSTPYPLVGFFILILVGELLTRTLFRKEKQLIKKRKTEEIPGWNIYMKLMLFILIAYPLLSIPRYLAGTPLKTLSAGYVALIAGFGTLGVLGRIVIRNKPEYMFTFPLHDTAFMLTFALVILACIGAFALTFAILMMIS